MTKKRRLGKTDIEITPIGLGCWQFSQGSKGMSAVWDAVNQETINGIVDTALKGGISWFDTAELYGRGTSEQTLAKALTAAGVRPGQVVVATKWWPLARRARSIEATIDTRLSCLSPFPIDLYQVHQPFSISSVAAQMKAMARILKAGKIRSVGVSNFSARRMELAHAALAAEGIVLASNQMRFNLLDRGIERNGVLSSAKKLGACPGRAHGSFPRRPRGRGEGFDHAAHDEWFLRRAPGKERPPHRGDAGDRSRPRSERRAGRAVLGDELPR